MPGARQLDHARLGNEPTDERRDKHPAHDVVVQGVVEGRERTGWPRRASEDKLHRGQRLRHQERRRDPLARDVADRKKNAAVTPGEDREKIAADVRRRFVVAGEDGSGDGRRDRAREQFLLDLGGDGHVAIHAFLLADTVDGAELFNGGGDEVRVGLKSLEVFVLERFLVDRIEDLEHTDNRSISLEWCAEDRARPEAAGLIGVAKEAVVGVGVGDQEALAVLQHPTGDALPA